MSLVLHPQVCSRDCTVSLPHTSSFNISSSSSNLAFGSHLHQCSLSRPHKSNASPVLTRRILAAYSGDSAPVPESPAKALRRILELPGVHQGPACFDGRSAKLVERAGFQYCFTSGFSISAARLGLPDQVIYPMER